MSQFTTFLPLIDYSSPTNIQVELNPDGSATAQVTEGDPVTKTNDANRVGRNYGPITLSASRVRAALAMATESLVAELMMRKNVRGDPDPHIIGSSGFDEREFDWAPRGPWSGPGIITPGDPIPEVPE